MTSLKKSKIDTSIYRVVESQSENSTRQLVDSDAEQEILENLIDESKPQYLNGTEKLPYLLKTPFRYPPLNHGSRFGSNKNNGIFYGSLEIETALCEVAYYRFRFYQDSSAELRPFFVGHTSFLTEISSKRLLNLTVKPYSDQREQFSSPTSYHHSQALADQARSEDIEVIKFYSARCKSGKNIAVLSPLALKTGKEKKVEYWDSYIDEDTVRFSKKNRKDIHVFKIDMFKINKKFPII